ncbi:hypothetical protein [Nitrosomonas communis]|uniref:Uncharacterized protein n=1 Tax=Nitrosomonas communis TaxID=44574 RepID=A0A1I4XBG0_9PROT|nr:hypothetical protein [Nitrosomonas communis]SFN23224.1 hypothetical protein SAMN05421863_11486 [Nitrosomonas communis]
MKKEQVRQLFPEACKLADDVRAVFYDADLKLVHLQEGERELGKPGERGVNPCGRGDEYVTRRAKRNDE